MPILERKALHRLSRSFGYFRSLRVGFKLILFIVVILLQGLEGLHIGARAQSRAPRLLRRGGQGRRDLGREQPAAIPRHDGRRALDKQVRRPLRDRQAGHSQYGQTQYPHPSNCRLRASARAGHVESFACGRHRPRPKLYCSKVDPGLTGRWRIWPWSPPCCCLPISGWVP